MEYPFVNGIAGYPTIIEVKKLEHEKVNFGGVWHTDTAYLDRPPMATLLLAREVPPQGGDTLFASQVAAYEALSDGMKRLLATLGCVNSSDKADTSRTREDRIAEGGRGERRSYETVHPAVRVHPETGRRALYMNAGHTVRFAGIDRRRERAAAGLPVRASEEGGVHLPLSLAGRLTRLVGQPLRAALSRQRLSRAPPRDAPHHAGGRCTPRLIDPAFEFSNT